jgi:hypothetical protein
VLGGSQCKPTTLGLRRLTRSHALTPNTQGRACHGYPTSPAALSSVSFSTAISTGLAGGPAQAQLLTLRRTRCQATGTGPEMERTSIGGCPRW